MRRKVSLKDIAIKTGVSTTLVSYVLNNQMLHRINKQTAATIRQTAREMGYRTNQIAKSLKKHTTHTIGIIVSDIANPFSSAIARFIEDEVRKKGYNVVFGSADENCEKAMELVDALLSKQVDGLVIAPPANFEKQLLQLQKEGVPFVTIDRYFDRLSVNRVMIDNFKAAYDAIHHLIGNGYRTIGLINYHSALYHLDQRTQGYKAALKSAGIRFNKKWIREIDESDLKKEISTALTTLLKEKPGIDALFFSSSKVAIEGLAYLNRSHIRVPEALAVVCFDETAAYELFPCPLTCVVQPLHQMGKNAVNLLFASIKGEVQCRSVILKTKLIIRESSRRRIV